jgi:hypothetical protein
MAKRIIYRDSITSQFVSEKKYNRSQAQGSARYRREVFFEEKISRREQEEEMDLDDWIAEHEDEPDEEIEGAFDYKKARK